MLIAFCAAGASAQPRGRNIYAEQLRVSLDERIPGAREEGFDAGGSFNFALMDYEDSSRHERTLRQFQFRLWANLNYRGVHRAYFRGLMLGNDWNKGDNPRFNGDDFDLEVERMWYQFDLERYMLLNNGQLPEIGLQVKVGRQFMALGTALALSTTLDAVKLNARVGQLEMMTFIGQTDRHSHNIDTSPAVEYRQERMMFGGQITCTSMDHHRPFVYFLGNRDNTEPSSGGGGQDGGQRYGYDSNYVGIGSTGVLYLPALRYSFETVGEWGDTYSNGATTSKDDIAAIALDFQLEYLFEAACDPRINFEYLFASGDADRGNAVATVGGNRTGTKDHAFNAFGYRDTGIAFAPAISNIHMYALGASCFPLKDVKCLEKMEIGNRFYFYGRHQRQGGISDASTTTNSGWLGWEWDAYCNWRLTSDLALTARYGVFMPGSAWDGAGKGNRHSVYFGVNYSF